VTGGEGNKDAITIRGQSTSADFFRDGIRDDAEYYRDLYNIQAVEVLKDPSALTFGRGGGGIVNRVKKKADGQTIRDIEMSFGSFGDQSCPGGLRHARGATPMRSTSTRTAFATSSSCNVTE
jgi:catecholate siderophore receptor